MTQLAESFLKRQLDDYGSLKGEVEDLQAEVDGSIGRRVSLRERHLRFGDWHVNPFF